MTRLSPGATLAWKIAAHEALQIHAEHLEVEHLFIGLMSMGKVLEPETPGKPRSADAKSIREWNALKTLLHITGHDPVVLRRLMRRRLIKGTGPAAGPVIHRSTACREYFARAGKLAGDKPVTSNDLFSAIMAKPGEIIPDVLAEDHGCIAAVRDSDIILPSERTLMEAGQITGPGYDTKEELSRDVERYAGSLAAWSPGSAEHRTTRQALRQKGTSLVQLCLSTRDIPGLLAALSHIALLAEGPAADQAARAIADMDKAGRNGRSTEEAIRRRVNDLLRRLDEEDETGQDHRDVPDDD